MTVAARITTLNTRLTQVQTAITNTLTRGVDGYSTGEGQSVTSMKLNALRAEEKSIISELARLNRGSRFGKVGFARVTE